MTRLSTYSSLDKSVFQVSKESGILSKGKKYGAAMDVKVYMLTLSRGSRNDLKVATCWLLFSK